MLEGSEVVVRYERRERAGRKEMRRWSLDERDWRLETPSATVPPTKSGTKKFARDLSRRSNSFTAASPVLQHGLSLLRSACNTRLYISAALGLCEENIGHGRILVYSRGPQVSLRRLCAFSSHCALFSSAASAVREGEEGRKQPHVPRVWTTCDWSREWEHRTLRVDGRKSSQPSTSSLGRAEGEYS